MGTYGLSVLPGKSLRVAPSEGDSPLDPNTRPKGELGLWFLAGPPGILSPGDFPSHPVRILRNKSGPGISRIPLRDLEPRVPVL